MDALIVPCTMEKVWDSKPGPGAVAAKDACTKPAFLDWQFTLARFERIVLLDRDWFAPLVRAAIDDGMWRHS
ncbi:MAG TPA: hypothetical protein VFX12_08540 [Vicinamibacterales bacterium]|nr:hypothetical protein [Vicinamibacterales bacterium]